ncbi:MAG: RluA family pseudouridine synthase [Chthoniobacteraceae bacterium]
MSLFAAEFQIDGSSAGKRLDHFLAAAVPQFTRSRLQNLTRDGHIRVNGEVAKPGVKLRLGDHITIQEPPTRPAEAQAEEIPLEVLFEDDDLIVINKAPGMVVHPAAGNWDGTIVNALLHHCRTLSGIGGEERPGIVHRLDKDTSGCLVAAKSDLAHQKLIRQFAGREITKIYLAIADGRFSQSSGSIHAPIGRHPIHRKKMAGVAEGKGRAAHTDWRVLQELPKGTLVECTLHTGRTHQIRVHLKHLGHPLLGDEVYGRKAGFPRQMLHAWQLGFTHPRTGTPLHLVAPIPQDFKDAGASVSAEAPE